MSAKFKIRNLTIELADGKIILQDITLDIPTHQVTCILGPSGSGKSTLLRCLNRLLEPPQRTVFLDGQDILDLPVLNLRRRVGMMFQSANLFDASVADNVRYGPRLQDLILKDDQVFRLLADVGLEPEIAPQSAMELSGGEAQRVALARTLANEPEVLLLDEPTSNLDPAATRKVEEAVRGLQNVADITPIFVSHDIDQVRRIADYVVLLSRGQIIETGSSDLMLGSAAQYLQQFAEGRF
jgi:ABC-type phosphate transport system ATPase subunit